MSFNRKKAEEIAANICRNDDERSLIPSFVEPELMQGYDLSEAEFKNFVSQYITAEKAKR